MDCISSLLTYTGQRLDDIISSVVLFVPFTCNKDNHVTKRTLTSQTSCPVAMDSINNGVANSNRKTSTTSAERTTTTGVDDEDFNKLKLMSLRSFSDSNKHWNVVKYYGETILPMDFIRENDFSAKCGIIVIKVAPEDVKMAKELHNMYKQYLKSTNETKIVTFEESTCRIHDCSNHRQLQSTSETEITVRSDIETPMAFPARLWKSIVAPFEVIVHMLPSSVFGESRHFNQVAAVYDGNFIDRLIKSLPISPFGGVNEHRLNDSRRRNSRKFHRHQLATENNKKKRASSIIMEVPKENYKDKKAPKFEKSHFVYKESSNMDTSEHVYCKNFLMKN